MSSLPERAEVRQRFLDRHPFALDAFQVEAMDAIDGGSSVLVAAPTGSGKTLVAEYAVAVALAEGTKVFYTTPLKALSNQKYHDLVRAHGAENVGLLTGDNAINGDAPAVVMTTEVLRNMIYAGSPALEHLGFVVLDEVHYLQNAYRGPVWEEVIIHAPAHVSLVCLSATVSNAEELTEWIETVRGSTVPIIEERRPVTLNHHYLVGEVHNDSLRLLPTFTPSGKPNPQGSAFDPQRGSKPWQRHGRADRGRYRPPGRGEVVELLRTEAMLPAIFFIFSRNACDQAVQQCTNERVHLTSPVERDRIREIAEGKVAHLSDEDLRVLGYDEWLAALQDGIAAHHAGMVPTFKEVVEECFAQALVKVVFATETLALGINMPARTVVIEKLSKFTGERHEFLTPGEYTQLTGRAGRRGIDDVGHAVVLWSPWVEFEQVASLASTRSYTLVSSFRPTYNMAANLVRRYPPDVAHHLLNLSFAQYRADADVVRLETQLERTNERVEAARRRAHCERGDVAAWLARSEGTDPGARRDTPEFVAKAISHLRVGDVIQDPGTELTRHVVVITTSQRRGHDTKLGVLTRDGRRFTLTARDFAVAPHRVRHLDLPRPYSPGNKDFVRRAASTLREQVADEPDEFVPRGYEDRRGVAGCPDLERHLKALIDVQRLEKDRERLERRVRGRAESLARQFDRVLDLLRTRGYVDGWELTTWGSALARIYHEADLLLAECLREGLLDGLDPPALAALVSTLTYERRGPAGTGPDPWFHTPAVERGWHAIESTWKDLAGDEQERALPLTKPPDAGFCAFAYAWVAGDELAHILEDEELSGGDFVRNVKQLMDLLGQVGEVAPEPATRAAARAASGELFRGIVAASSVTPERSGPPTTGVASPVVDDPA